MGQRTILKPGTVITMPNNGRYIIGNKIGEGGLSLLYNAKTKGNEYPVIIKEFFPAVGAYRAKNSKNNQKKGCVYPEANYAERFNKCKEAFEREGVIGNWVQGSNFQVIAFSDCGKGYAVLPRWSEDTYSLTDLVDGWKKEPPKELDPYFTDNGRIKFALVVIESLLNVVDALHKQGVLHLDISGSNVVWSGNRTSEKNGTTRLTDFGCSVLMSEGSYPAQYALSYSKEYAAPEYMERNGELTTATDIYAIGCLLTYLCVGERAFYNSDNEYLIYKLHISDDVKRDIWEIIKKATHSQCDKRYQTAIEMKSQIEVLLRKIPINPVNVDATKAFSLYSLKSMLGGSKDTRYSWAHELCDRRHITYMFGENIIEPISSIRWKDDIDFLETVLPEEVFSYLKQKINEESDQKHTVQNIMTGNYPNEWKNNVVHLFNRCGTRRLLEISRTLLENEKSYYVAQQCLFEIIKEDGSRLIDCYFNCGNNIRRFPYIGLAMIIMYALLGQDGFEVLMKSPSTSVTKFFLPL